MKYLVITRRTPGFDAAHLPAHYDFLAGLRAAGWLEQAGPFADKTGGAYVLLSGSLAEAQATAADDPLSRHGCSQIQVLEWSAA